MNHSRHSHWPCSHTISIVLVASLLLPSSALAAERNATLEMRPFCTSEQNNDETILGPIPDVEGYVTLGDDTCPSFIVEDPETLRTAPLSVGDNLDIDIIIRNPSEQPITHVRSWLSYDSSVLEGKTIEVNSNFPSVTPGESNFDAENGFVMIEASNESEDANTKKNVLVARIRFTVKSASPAGSPISFYDAQEGGHSVITTTENSTDEYILAEVPGSLHVVFAEDAQESSEDDTDSGDGGNGDGSEDSGDDDGGSVQTGDNVLDEFGSLFEELEETNGSSGDESESNENEEPADEEENQEEVIEEDSEEDEEPEATPTPPRTAFALLQVRNVRVTTEGTSLYIGWDALNHLDLKAYNVYYGTTSGRYIQRKTVDKDMKSLIIRALPYGTTYYVAVRAVSNVDEESAFSKEASVEIGSPLTSTAPLVAGAIDGGPNGVNPVEANLGGTQEVPGEVGVPSGFAMLLLVSAVTGTAIAFRRQTVVASAHHIK